MDPGKALRALSRTSAAAVSVAILVTTASQTARADDAAQILKAMTDYTGAEINFGSIRQRYRGHHIGASENPVHQFRADEPH